MSSIVSAFDKHLTAKQLGEKVTWKTRGPDYERQLYNSSFSLFVVKILAIWRDALKNAEGYEMETDKLLLTTLYKLIGQTRDIVSGVRWILLGCNSRFGID